MNFNNLNNIKIALNVSVIFIFGLVWLGAVAFLKLKKRKSLVYLLFFTLFYIYLYKVLDYTLFQFQSLLFLRHFEPSLMLKGQTAEKSLNLIPLVTLRLTDVKTSFLNILLFIPFGFGLPFISNLRMKKLVIIGALFSLGIEFLQFITGFAAKTAFRIADINDVIFNTVGVVLGYLVFLFLAKWMRSGFMRGGPSLL